MNKISKSLLLLTIVISSFVLITNSTKAMEDEGNQAIDDQILITNRGLPEFIDAVALFTDDNENQNIIGENQANRTCKNSINKLVVKIIRNSAIYSASGAVIVKALGIQNEEVGLYIGLGLSILDAISSIFDNYYRLPNEQAQQQIQDGQV